MGNRKKQSAVGQVRALVLAGACAAALLAAGCGLFQDEPEPLELGTPDTPLEEARQNSGQGAEQKPAPGGPAAKELPDSLDTDNIILYSAEEAPQFPEITVKKPDGSTTKLQPAEDGKVVMVTCWSLANPTGRAAAMYANQLGRKYYGQGLRVLGLVSLRKDSERDPRRALQRFLKRQNIRYRLFGLTTDALSRIAETAYKGEALPNFSIIDRKGRLRFYQKGFSYTMGSNPRFGQQVYENALYGRKVEDFVRKVLKEGRPDAQLPQRMRRQGKQERQSPRGQQNRRQPPLRQQDQGENPR